MPSLLLHTFLALLEEQREVRNKTALEHLMVFSYYVPAGGIPAALAQMVRHGDIPFPTCIDFFIIPFFSWFVFALLITKFISDRLSRSRSLEGEKKFYKTFGRIMLGISAFLAFTFILGKKIPIVGDYLVLITTLSAIIPCILFSYYIYRHNYIEDILKGTVFYSLITTLLALLYLGLLGYLGEYLKKFSINVDIIRFSLVILILFLFPIFKRKLADFFNNLLFTPTEVYRSKLMEIMESFRSASYDKLPQLIRRLHWILEDFLQVSNVKIFFLDEKFSFASFLEQPSIGHLKKFLETRQIKRLDRIEIIDPDVRQEIEELRAFRILSIYRDEKPSAIVCLGERPLNLPIRDAEMETLELLTENILVAMENAYLLHSKLLLESKIFGNERLRSLGILAASVAHEVKNPLSSIKSIMQVMLEDLPADQANHKDISIVLEEIDRLIQVVKNLLQFSRSTGENGIPVSISEIVDNVLLILNHQIRRQEVTVKKQVDAAFLKSQYYADNLKEILFNLVLNSLQAMSGKARSAITIRVKKRHDVLKIFVADNGPGIDQKSLGKIFDPFYSTKPTGTGLGLAIVKRKAQEMGGRVRVMSMRNKGTVFIIIIKSGEETLWQENHS
jgi:signal transduction histidine kinase